MNDMRNLLSGAIPDPEDEPGLRDVIGPAMAWGDRRRRLEWSLAGAAALAVVALGAGVASLGGSSRDGNASPAGGPSPSGVASSSANGGVLPCTLPGGQPGQPGSDYCNLQAEVQGGFNREFAAGALQFVQADLPQGIAASAPQSEPLNASNPGYLVLSGPGGKNLLYLGLAVPNSSTPGVVVGSAPSMGESAQWADGSATGTRLVVNVTTTDAVGNPTAKAPLLTPEQLKRILSDPALQRYAGDQNKRWEDINRRFQHYLPPSPTFSSVSPPTGSLSSSQLSWPPSQSGSVSPPSFSSPNCVVPPAVTSHPGGLTAGSSPSCLPSSWPSSPGISSASPPPVSSTTSMPVPTGSHS